MSLLEERMANPPHHGPLANATGVGAVGNPACGDVLTVYLRVEGETVAEASFESMGSAYQLATASVLCDCVTGCSVAEARAQTPECVLGMLPELPENKRYLGYLALDALQRALDNHLKHGDGKPSERDVMSQNEAEGFVVGLLANKRQWGTLEIDAMARADGLGWPMSLAKLLAQMRKAGRIGGEMRGTSWRWWAASQPADRGRQPGE